MVRNTLGRVRPKLTYANVVATIALFLALGFGSVYAAGKITGKNIKPNSIPANRIQNGSLTAQQINSSALGTVPSASHAGSADTAANSVQLGGLGPSDYGAVLSGRMTGLTTTANAFDNGAPSGLSTATTTASNEMLSPDQALTARDLFVHLTNAPGGTASRSFFVIVNGTGVPNLTCTIQGSANSCNSGSQSRAVPAGAALEITDKAGGVAPAGAEAFFGFRLTP